MGQPRFFDLAIALRNCPIAGYTVRDNSRKVPEHARDNDD